MSSRCRFLPEGRPLVNKDKNRDDNKGKDKKGEGKGNKKEEAAGDHRRDKSGSRTDFRVKTTRTNLREMFVHYI